MCAFVFRRTCICVCIYVCVHAGTLVAGLSLAQPGLLVSIQTNMFIAPGTPSGAIGFAFEAMILSPPPSPRPPPAPRPPPPVPRPPPNPPAPYPPSPPLNPGSGKYVVRHCLRTTLLTVCMGMVLRLHDAQARVVRCVCVRV